MPRERGRARLAQCTCRTGTRQLRGDAMWRVRPDALGLPDACSASGGGAERGEERVDLDLAHRAIADGRVEHAGEREVEAAPVADGALRPDLPVMCFDDPLADGEAQAGAAL